MVKLINPLMSFTASGSLKKTITYSSVNGVSVAKLFMKYSLRRKISPSFRQIQIQENFKHALFFYNSATIEEINLAYNSKTKNISGKNNLVMLPILKYRPVLLGICFIGDNTLGF